MLQFAAARMTFVICATCWFRQPTVPYAGDFSQLSLKRFQFAWSVLYLGRGKVLSGRVGVFMWMVMGNWSLPWRLSDIGQLHLWAICGDINEVSTW